MGFRGVLADMFDPDMRDTVEQQFVLKRALRPWPAQSERPESCRRRLASHQGRGPEAGSISTCCRSAGRLL